MISLHTIYHVPRAEQATAVDELVRVTKAGGRTLVVYIWDRSPAMTAIFALRGRIGRVRRWLRRAPPVVPGPAAAGAAPPLYFHPQNYCWFRRAVAGRHGGRLSVWSAVSTQFQIRFITDDFFGRVTLALVKLLEAAFPWLAGRLGQYPLFIIDKEG